MDRFVNALRILLLLFIVVAVEPHSTTRAQETFNYMPKQIGWHEAMYDDDENEPHIVPWTTWADALEREMKWYLNAPINEYGYPSFVHITFMDEKYQCYRNDFIPATQNGMGIISYVKYWNYKNKSNPKVLEFAKMMGNYLVKEANSPSEGAYPRFTRSTGFYELLSLTKFANFPFK